MSYRAMSSLQHLQWIREDLIVLRWLESVLAKLRHWKLAGQVLAQMPWPRLPRQVLATDLFLQGHEGVNQGLRTRGTTGNVDIDRDVAVDSLEYVVAVAKGPTGNGARSHSDDVFRFRHLVIETNHLGSHLLGHRSGDDHQVSLPRRGPEDLGAEASQIVARHGGRDHFNGAAGQAEGERPNGILAAPVIELLKRGGEDAVLA